MEYYVFQTEEQASTCIASINGSGWFPIVGLKNGSSSPSSKKTEKWIDEPTQMTSGEWTVPRIPESRLDFIGVPSDQRAAFLAAFGQDIRDLASSDFPAPSMDP